MSRETLWSVLLIVGGGFGLALVQLIRLGEAGTVYVREVDRTAAVAATEDTPEQTFEWTTFEQVKPRQRDEPRVSLSIPRTLGLWIAAFCTLAIFSFLAGDNPVYKLAESIFVGVSAGYAMVAAFWDELVPNLFVKLAPETMRDIGWGNLDDKEVPGLWNFSRALGSFDSAGISEHAEHLITLVPLVLSAMMLWQLASRGGWIARWPLAFFIGATAGIRLYTFFESDFLQQIQQTLLPLAVIVYEDATRRSVDWSKTFTNSLENLTIVVGVLSSLTYFFFSIEHRGPVRVVTRLGIYVLMITFGAGFAYTVMGRVALLIERLEFLFIDWLWLIEPLNTHG